MKLTICRIAVCLAVTAFCAAPPAAWAEEYQEVELFAAMAAGDLEVKLIPRDAKQANVIIKNNLDKPVRIKLPDAFAGVPVLAQIGGGFGGGGMGGMGGMGGGGMNQGMGGGMGGMGMGGGMGGGGMGGGGGGFFNVGPEKVGKFKVATVCLEHGKADPNPRVPYELKPITEFTKDPHAIEICKMLGRYEIDQASAQAAAWHYTDGLSWQELVTKVGVRHLNGTVKPFFTQVQVARAVYIAQEAAKRAKAAPSPQSDSIAGAEGKLSQN